MGYLSAALVCTTLGVNSVIYEDEGSKQSAAAGFILMSMVVVSGLEIKRTRVGMLMTIAGCLDFLFRIKSSGVPSRLYRFVCAS